MPGQRLNRPSMVFLAADVPPVPLRDSDSNVECVTRGHLRRDGLLGFLRRRLFRYASVAVTSDASQAMRKPAAVLIAARLMTFGPVTIVSPDGRRDQKSTADILISLLSAAAEMLLTPVFLLYARIDLAVLARRRRATPQLRTRADQPRRGLFVALVAGVAPAYGGAVSHFRGIVGGAQRAGLDPVVISTLPMDGLADVPAQLPPSLGWFRNVDDGQAILTGLFAKVPEGCAVGNGRIDFVYERLSAYSTLGLRLARQMGTPFILEYNGSERWMAERWGRGVRWPGLVSAVERANLAAADLVSVVSDRLAEIAVENGARQDRVTVIPNGVDTERFHPDVAPALRLSFASPQGRITIGFAGTFGPWHGVTVLVDAFGLFLKEDAAAAQRLHLLLIGSGALMEQVLPRVSDWPEGVVTLAGDVPPEDMPRALAACDVLVSPQLPTDDEGGFFGDPIKLYEYMAMGKAVIASRLGRIPEVLEDGVSGVLVPAGDSASLAGAIQWLAEDSRVRASFGAAARRRVVEQCSWRRRGDQLAAALEKLGC